jgi:transcriptional regulator with GAF, ATPase, and Fis domain
MGMRVESAEQRLVRLEEQVELWRAEHDHQTEREQVLRQRLDDQVEGNRRCVEQLAAAEQRIGHLAKLQAAVRELHEAAMPADVLTTIKEIVANLIGCEEMGIYARRPDGGLTLLDGIGVDADHEGTEATAIVSIPLHLNQRVVGMIALFKLLPQKTGIEPVDQELFQLLSTHAARALHHAGLRAWARSQGVCL